MGDRNNPIKFGPEWLRNLSRERSAVRASNNQAANSNMGAAAGAGAAGPSGGVAAGNGASNTANNTNTHNTAGPPKVLLAKLRYGREEMLALYDRNADAPPELKFIDTLYQPRGKQPLALNNTFEDDMRDNMRNAPPVGGMSSADRYGMGRGAGRGGTGTGRGTGARTYTRPSTTARGSWHVSSTRTPSYGGGADEDGGQMRPWNNNSLANRNSGDQTDWANKTYRSKRQGANTNWRQHPTRDESDEWRSSEPGRSRQLEKWDRDWGERPSADKPQSSWNTNRRTWVSGDTHSNENLPEWIGENAECGGTFDSQGAFHGYSNDDTNLPITQETSHPLTRSHTHGSFVRSKTIEEGSDEWWASEKAKKLSPKRFDASDIKFKKQLSSDVGPSASTSKEYGNKNSNNKDELKYETQEQQENTTAPEPPEPNNTAQNEDKYGGKKLYKTKYAESKTFDGKMRSDINMDEANDERGGNFQSVIIAPNNSLRQKHQNMVPANEPPNKALSSKTQSTKTSSSQNKPDVDHAAHKSQEDVLVVNNMFRMPYNELEILSSTSPSNSSLLTLSSTGMSAGLNSSTSTMSHQNSTMQMHMSSAAMPNQGLTMDLNINKQNIQVSGHETPGIQTRVHPSIGMQSGMQMQSMPTSGMQPGKQTVMHSSGMSQHGIQNTGMPSNSMQNPGLSQVGLPSSGKPSGMQNHGMPSVSTARMSMPLQNSGMGRGVMQNPGIHASGLPNQGMPATSMHVARVQNPNMQSSMIQQGGMTNSALNASLGLPIGPGVNMGMPLQNVPQPVYPNADNMSATGMQAAIGNASMQSGGNIPGFQPGNSITGGNNSLFLGQTSNNPAMPSTGDIPMPNHAGQNNMYPMHALQHSGSQSGFGNVMYGNNMPNPAEQWYYEDPESNIQGPFSTRDMLNWYRAGFFSSTLMVRRACETGMRPLGSYGPVPFTTMDMMPQFPMSGSYDARPQGAHETMMNSQAGLGLDVMKINRPNNPPVQHVPFGSVRQVGIQTFNQPRPMVDLLWGQPSNDLRWMHNSINDSRVNNLSMFFWDQQPSAIASNALLPEEITKEMKTEDQILAQLRASQNIAQPASLPFMEQAAASAAAPAKPDDRFAAAINATPNLEELHRLMQKDTLTGSTPAADHNPLRQPETTDTQPKTEKVTKPESAVVESNNAKAQNTSKATVEQKAVKQKADNDKAVKNKENNITKNKSKKSKDEKKDEAAEVKTKEDDVIKAEKRSQESSPSKSKKEDKSNNIKKELEREKKEWIKEGFTIVKGPEKTVAKDGKRKAEETRAAEEMERKRKEEERIAAEEEKKKKQAEALKKQEQQQQQQQRQASESAVKKAPWSAIANLTLQAVHREGPTLAEIQRLEREKKLEQMKEQQQMMQIIAEQQAVALAREQEMQAGLGWAKKKGNNFNAPGPSLTEIQAEARKQAVVAVVAAQAQAFEELTAAAPPQTNHAPWANTHNGVGFWDTPPNQLPKPEKPQEPAKPAKPAEPSKTKKKITLTIPAKKEVSPAAEFETWCTTFLAPWSAKIDVPTFIGFLRDIESPYEVKDYVKCYLGDSKDSNDFARQFLERRSKLLRVGMVTPSDDLCSPAIAVNPRTISGSDYQEVKGKGKKTKKNKMLKIDARILGFSVTAAEDRINVGDIDSV